MPEFITVLADNLLSPARLPYAVLALALCAVIGAFTGPFKSLAAPMTWLVFNKTLGGIGKRLDRRERPQKDRFIRGVIFTFLVTGLSLGAAWAGFYLIKTLPSGRWLEVLFLSFCLSSGTVAYLLQKLYQSDKKKKPQDQCYYSLAQSTLSDYSGSDDFRITRGGIEWAALSFDRAVVAPVFWYLLAGLTGAWLWSALSWMGWYFGRAGTNKGFGSFVLFLEKWAGYFPSFIAGFFIACAALFTPTARFWASLKELFSFGKKAPYHQGGMAVAALAQSLNISVGGPYIDQDGITIKRLWVGPSDATAKLGSYHLRRTLYILLIAYLLLTTGLMAALIWS